MEYHEIGEQFEYDGVMLEVVKRDNCEDCFFLNSMKCGIMSHMRCNSLLRRDDTSISYKLVEQCKTKDMEQKTEIKVEGTDKTFATQVTNPQEAQYAMVEKFADDLLHYAEECERQAIDYFFTHIPLPYGLKQ